MIGIYPEQRNDSAVLMSVAANMLWLCMVGGRPTLDQVTLSLLVTS